MTPFGVVQELQLSSTQLLYAIAFPQALMCFVLAGIFETNGELIAIPISQHEFSGFEWVLVFVSCVLAMGVNLSSMGLIGKTSAITYQVG